MRQDFDKPHDRKLVHGKDAVQPFVLHRRAADSGETDGTPCRPLERRHKPGADRVARRLAHDHEDQRSDAHRSTVSTKRNRPAAFAARIVSRSEEHTSELQSLMRISYAVFCLKKKKQTIPNQTIHIPNTTLNQNTIEVHHHTSK